MKHLFTKTNIGVLIIALILGVIAFSISLHRSRSHFPNSFVMKYADFGSPSSSDELLGPESPHGVELRDDIQVVVYRNVDLATVKRTYPEFGGKPVYRYVEYSQAIDYLDKQIEGLKAHNETDAEYGKLKQKLISKYEQSKSKLIERLGS